MGMLIHYLQFHTSVICRYCDISIHHVLRLIGNMWLARASTGRFRLGVGHRDPTIARDDWCGNRSHLAFGARAHACPAGDLAQSVAVASGR
ncbi:hypothetical protein [Nocardia rhamnosiphila]|uniref:Uncharacterized protein n=1 Tax=Nocardia rhamnosiphila TaxID=426716 RepID=A0ABV2WRC6_9NOCA